MARRVAPLLGLLGLLAAVVGAASSCSDKTPEPPMLGGCSGEGDASCKPFAGGGGGAAGGAGAAPSDAGGEVDGQSEPDAQGEPTDAALTCPGTAPLLAALSPTCASCVAAGQDAGSLSCCGLAQTCAMDPGCMTILHCALTCAAGAACLTQTCAPMAPLSVVAFNTLANCMSMLPIVCPGAMCPPLSPVSTAD